MMTRYVYTEEELIDSPSRKDGVDEAIETHLRAYGCSLIQAADILLKLPQSSCATGQTLFHRFYCKQSFVRFNVTTIAAACIWLASKYKENPRKARQVVVVFHRMELRRKNNPIDQLDIYCQKYPKLKRDLMIAESWVLKELGFICHVEYPHIFISNYLSSLEAPKLRQEAWSIANDSLRTTLCVRFKAEVVACGVIYAASRRLQVPLPENPPWWEAFDAGKSEIDEVCRVLANLYSLGDVRYIPVCGDSDFFSVSGESWDLPLHTGLLGPVITWATAENAAKLDSVAFKEVVNKPGINKLKENSKIGDDSERRSRVRNRRVGIVSEPSGVDMFARSFPRKGEMAESMNKQKIEETVSKSRFQHRNNDMGGSTSKIYDGRGDRDKQRYREGRRERLKVW